MSTPGSQERSPVARILRRLARLALPVMLIALVLILVRSRLGDIYLVRGQSMAPGFQGGRDRILVVRGWDPPDANDRFRPWVYRSESDYRSDDESPDAELSRLRLKRIIGLSGEVLDFQGGDIFVGPDRDSLSRLARADPVLEAMLIPVFLSREHNGSRRFHVSVGRLEWSSEGALRLDARAGGLGLMANLIGRRYDRSEAIHDDGVDASGKPVVGQHIVPDLRLDFLVTEIIGDGVLSLRHSLNGEWREVRIRPGSCTVVMESPDKVAHEVASHIVSSLPLRVRMETIDGRWRVSVGSDDEHWKQIHSGDRDTRRYGGHSSVALALDRGCARLGFLDIKRDVHYFWPPALDEAHKIRKGRVFLVGDNLVSSRDSREDDDVSHEALIGRAVAIVWPPARWRSLGW